MANGKMCEAALHYAQMGLAVLPLHSIYKGKCSCGNSDCGSPGKHPRTKNGVKEASKVPAQIREWWGAHPHANIGIATGRISGIIVIDVDGEEGEESLANLESDYGPLPDTWEQLTGGGGRHIVLRRMDWAKVKNRVRLAPGLDVRADDGYIVAEPSVHSSGRMYYWEIEHLPEEIPLADVPAEWAELFREQPREYHKTELPANFPQGERNTLLFKLGASLRARGLSDAALLAALREENRSRCQPPLEDREVQTIATSCARYMPGEILSGPAAALAVQPDTAVDMEAFAELLRTEKPYSDAVIGVMVQMDESGSPLYYDALQQLRALPGFRERDFTGARKKYLARRRGLKVVQNGEDIPTLDKQIPGLPLEGAVMPGEWRLSQEGLIFRLDDRRDGGTPMMLVACPHPVFPVERLHNLDSGTEKLRVAFFRDQRWNNVVVDASTASSRNSIVRLSNYGLQVTSESAKHLVMFLADFATANKTRLPLRRSTARLGWTGAKEFAPYAPGVAYDGELAYQFVYNAVRTEGEYAQWVSMAALLRRSPLLRVVMAASFASPIVALIGYQPFFLHLWGDSGSGKTVAQQMALSVWGDPAQLIKTLNTTIVGLERHAAFFHSLPVCLDELQALLQKHITIDKIVYALALGKSKGRGTGDGGIETESEWHNIFITSGEEPMSQENTAGGARNRVIELYMDADAYELSGVEAGELAIWLHSCFGHAGPRLIEGVAAEGKKAVLELWTVLRNAIKDKEFTDKHINNIAMLAAGDYYASRFIFGNDEVEAKSRAVMLAVWILERIEKASQVDPVRRAWDFVNDWVAANWPRFQMEYDGFQPRLGWKTFSTEDESEMLLVIPQQLSDALRDAGFNAAKSLRGFCERGYMKSSTEGDKARYSIKRVIAGKSQRVNALWYPLIR